MRGRSLGLAAAILAISVLIPAERASAQLGVGSDVFSFYYGYYLPHQQYMANQSTPMDTLNQITAARQSSASTDRSSLYDPISPYGDEDDPLGANSKRSGRSRSPSASNGGMFGGGSIRGSGPPLYYGRTAQYFPMMRSGRGPNRNLAVTKSRGGGGGMGGMGGGMGGMGGGMGGMGGAG